MRTAGLWWLSLGHQCSWTLAPANRRSPSYSSSTKTGRIWVRTLFFKWAIPGLFFVYFCLFNTVDSAYKFCQWPDSNCGPLVSEATALPTAPQPLPKSVHCCISGVAFPYYYLIISFYSANAPLPSTRWPTPLKYHFSFVVIVISFEAFWCHFPRAIQCQNVILLRHFDIIPFGH